MMQTFLSKPTKEGYLLIPRLLLRPILFHRTQTPMCEEEAFLTLLFLANFTDGKLYGQSLKRGEVMGNIEKWSEVFNWSQYKVRNFLSYLENKQIISKIKSGKRSILRIEYYDLYCANKKIVTETPEVVEHKNKNDELFEQFWQSYHTLSGLEPSDEGKAKRFWKKLSLREKTQAVGNIYEYIMRVEKIKYIKKAANYLADRAFE